MLEELEGTERQIDLTKASVMCTDENKIEPRVGGQS